MAVAAKKQTRTRTLIAASAFTVVAYTASAWAVPTPISATGSVPCAYCRALPYSGMRDTVGSSHADNVAALFRRGGNIAGLFQQRNAVRGGYPSHMVLTSPMTGPNGIVAINGTPVNRFELPAVTAPDLGAIFGSDSFRALLSDQADQANRLSAAWYGLRLPAAP